MIRIAGENGIAAYGVIMYVQFIFIAIYIGYAIGTAPIISYNYGAGNQLELQNVFKKSAMIVSGGSVLLTIVAILMAGVLSGIFVSYDAMLFEMTKRGFVLCSFSFLFSGIGIFGSSLFTALNNGIVSAIISFLRSVIFQVIAVMVLPIFWGIDGIWASVSLAELAGMCITVFFILALRKKYHYWR